MKKYILTIALALAFAYPAGAWDLGNGISIDNEIEAKYNLDTPATTLTMQSGVTLPMLGMDWTVDADFDLNALGSSSTADLYKGLDIGVDYDISNNLVLELDTGMDTDWAREDINLSMTLSF
tara:strand:- start:1306 stop:1671 length:366 start_codon:yes stop_codon:yes gene_type:complete